MGILVFFLNNIKQYLRHYAPNGIFSAEFLANQHPTKFTEQYSHNNFYYESYQPQNSHYNRSSQKRQHYDFKEFYEIFQEFQKYSQRHNYPEDSQRFYSKNQDQYYRRYSRQNSSKKSSREHYYQDFQENPDFSYWKRRQAEEEESQREGERLYNEYAQNASEERRKQWADEKVSHGIHPEFVNPRTLFSFLFPSSSANNRFSLSFPFSSTSILTPHHFFSRLSSSFSSALLLLLPLPSLNLRF